MSDKFSSFKDFKLLIENFKNFIKTEETEYNDAPLDDGTLVYPICLKELLTKERTVAEETNKDACYYKAKAKYKVWPSAYASGYLVKCRNKKGNIKEEEIEFDEQTLQDLSEFDEKADFSKEKSQGLHGWFSRQGAKGKNKGWVDCNTCRTDKETGRKTCNSCGRQSGEKRADYPACRPTPSQCNKTGMKAKKNSKQVSWKKSEKNNNK